MEKEAQKFIINQPKLQGLLEWADAATKDSEGDFKPVGKRAVAIGNAIDIGNAIGNAIANAINNANVIANANAIANANVNAIALAEEFKEIKIFKEVNWTELIAQLKELQKQLPDTDQPEQIHLAFADRLLDIWCNALHLDPEIVKLSEEEAMALGDYLSANHLIIQCKEAAVRISAKTWEEIESRMLLVPDN